MITKLSSQQSDFESKLSALLAWESVSNKQVADTVDEIIASIKEMDSLLGYIITRLETLDIYNQLNIIIVSDHGMTDVSSKRIIVLDDYISRMDALYIRGRGSHVQFDIKEGYNEYEDIFVKELTTIPKCKYWKKCFYRAIFCNWATCSN